MRHESRGTLAGRPISPRAADVRPVLARYGPAWPGSTNAEVLAAWEGVSVKMAARRILTARRLGFLPDWVLPGRMLRPEPVPGIEV